MVGSTSPAPCGNAPPANCGTASLPGPCPPASRVDLDAITEEFATSRTPVREALLELSFEGLVQVAPRSGITVIGISPDDVLDSFTILGVLTGQAAAWAAERIEPEELQHAA